MNAIVFVFMPAHDGEVASEKAGAVRSAEMISLSVGSGGAKQNLLGISSRDAATPPLWTWFIENPRSSCA
jgi:hypothetical protein